MTVFFKNEANNSFKSFKLNAKATYAKSIDYVTKEQQSNTRILLEKIL
jgi:hypothetical protein